MILRLSPETIWRIFYYVDSPIQVYTKLPFVCSFFNRVIKQRSVIVEVNLEIVCDNAEQQSLLQLPDSLKLLHNWNYSIENNDILHIGCTRSISIHETAITDEPSKLVGYLDQLLKRTNYGSRKFRIVYGTIQLQGKPEIDVKLIAEFIGATKAQAVDIWHWDTCLLEEMSRCFVPKSLRLPSMKTDGHVTFEDFRVLSNMENLEKLELFRPFPRSPWGIESHAFAALSSLKNFRSLSISSGRLIQRSNAFKDAILEIGTLEVLDVSAWNFDIVYSHKILHSLKALKSLQFVHVSSPDFWINLPSYYEHSSKVSDKAIKLMLHLGLHYVQPDVGDFASLAQGIIRCFPLLHSLTVRISRPHNSEYDLFSISKESLSRILNRLEEKTNLKIFTIEIGSRMWSSRKSFADELMASFSNRRMRVKISCPLLGRVVLHQEF